MSESFAGLMIFLIYSAELLAIKSIPGNVARCTMSCGTNSTTELTPSYLTCGYSYLNFTQPAKFSWVPMLGPAERPQFSQEDPLHSMATIAIFTFLVYLPLRLLSLLMERKMLQKIHIKAIAMALEPRNTRARSRKNSAVTSSRILMWESGSFTGTLQELEAMSSHRGTMTLLRKMFSLPWSKRVMFMSIVVITFSILEGESRIKYSHD